MLLLLLVYLSFSLSFLFFSSTNEVRSFHPAEQPSEKCLNNSNLSNVYFEIHPPSLSPFLRASVSFFIRGFIRAAPDTLTTCTADSKLTHCYSSTRDLCSMPQLGNGCIDNISINLQNPLTLPSLDLIFLTRHMFVLLFLFFFIQSYTVPPHCVCGDVRYVRFVPTHILSHILFCFHVVVFFSKFSCNCADSQI